MNSKLMVFAVLISVLAIHAADGDVSPRANLSVTSKAAASTKTPAVLADVTFTVAATGNGTITYSWDFGDGTPAASGTSVVHAYAVAGNYTATATITDATGQTATSAAPVQVTDVVKSPKLFVTLDFQKAGNDTINFVGTLRLPPNAKLSGKVFAVDIGGVLANLTLNERGTFADTNNSVKVMAKSRADDSVGLNAKFYLRLKGSFQDALTDETLTNRMSDREPVKIKVKITLLDLIYQATITQEYNAAKGIKGATR